MPYGNYDRKQLQQLRTAAKELGELRLQVGSTIDQIAKGGGLARVEDAFAELTARTSEYEKLRATCSPEILYIAKYNIEVHLPHQVSCILPRGVSRYDMLCEAQEVVAARDERFLVWPNQLKTWQKENVFQAPSRTPEQIWIDGHVEGGDGKTREEQGIFLKTNGLLQASLEDLAAAFVGYYVATGEPLFSWYDEAGGLSFIVRAEGGVLYFTRDGLCMGDIDDAYCASAMAVAAHM